MPEAPLTRVWRLAAALSASPDVADAVVRRVARACPGLEVIDEARLDRLAVLWARQARDDCPAGDAPGGVASRSAQSHAPSVLPEPMLMLLAAVGGQPREAWMLSRVFGHEIVHVARSMDCSRTAAQRYLDQADAKARSLAPPLDAAELKASIRAWLDAQPAGARAESTRLDVARRRRHRRTMQNLTGGLLVLLGLWALLASIGS